MSAGRRILWEAERVGRIPNGQYNTELREPRIGVMIHFDASRNDDAALEWFRDPRCKVSYNYLVLDDGSYGEIAPMAARAWHAGLCRSSDPDRLPYRDANSAFVGIAAATDKQVGVTALQLLTIAFLTRVVFATYHWSPRETWRIVGHETEAWERGRKTDPTGDLERHPILSVEDVRALVPLMDPIREGT